MGIVGEDPHLFIRSEGTRYVDDSIGSNNLAIYIRDIGKIPLLTAEEEVSLAKQIEEGRKAKNNLDAKTEEEVITSDETVFLKEKAEAGEAAFKKMQEANLRLVISVARKYIGRGLPLGDLIQEGGFGLRRAVEKYDYRKGFRFSTYAYWWIRQSITRSIADCARTIRLPVHISEEYGAVNRACATLREKLGREPSNREIADYMSLPQRKIERLFMSIQRPISLETPVGKEEDSTLGNFIPDITENTAESGTDSAWGEAVRAEVRGCLTEREWTIISSMFGLGDTPQLTLAEAGKPFGISRERARQLKVRALWILSQNPRLRQLMSLSDKSVFSTD